MKRTHKIVAVTLAAMSVAAVTAVFANPGPGMSMGMGMDCGPMGAMHGASGPGGRMTGGGMAANMDAHMSANMGELKSELKITAAQEPAWQAFSAKAAQQAQAMQGMRGKMPVASGSAPDQMAQHAEFMKQRTGNMEAMSAALKDLYAVLTPEQKATADQRFGHLGGRHMARGGAGR
jgi:Spy/CpxP family protein refolding chaperone